MKSDRGRTGIDLVHNDSLFYGSQLYVDMDDISSIYYSEQRMDTPFVSASYEKLWRSSTMMTKLQKVALTLKTNENIAKEVAYEVLKRANPHDSILVDQKLNDNDITLDNLTKYFIGLQYVVAEFWNGVSDTNFKPQLLSHEVRGLFLPMLYSVIFASVGNCTIGNYTYELKAMEVDGKSFDKNWIIDFSAKLESMRMYVKGDTAQIGNRNAVPQTSVMLSLLSEVIGKEATILVRDGAPYDKMLAGHAALIGMTLVNESYDILYTGVDNINFRDIVSSVKESESLPL